MKIEYWNGYQIRFIEIKGEWFAVLKDVCDALGLRSKKTVERLEDEALKRGVTVEDTSGRMQEMILIDEFGIYDTIFRSNKPEAKDFKRWVYGMLKDLRESTGLKGFEVFRMLDKEHQKEMMRELQSGLRHPVRVDFIKANTIANKAISNKHGLPKMVKKDEMTPEMLKEREPILEDTVDLMKAKERFELNDLSVSKKIYQMYN
nr:MAG TPA: repressor domain protein [Caudoviricetes sp.]